MSAICRSAASRRKKRGVTWVELMTFVAIAGATAAVGVKAYSGSFSKQSACGGFSIKTAFAEGDPCGAGAGIASNDGKGGDGLKPRNTTGTGAAGEGARGGENAKGSENSKGSENAKGADNARSGEGPNGGENASGATNKDGANGGSGAGGTGGVGSSASGGGAGGAGGAGGGSMGSGGTTADGAGSGAAGGDDDSDTSAAGRGGAKGSSLGFGGGGGADDDSTTREARRSRQRLTVAIAALTRADEEARRSHADPDLLARIAAAREGLVRLEKRAGGIEAAARGRAMSGSAAAAGAGEGRVNGPPASMAVPAFNSDLNEESRKLAALKKDIEKNVGASSLLGWIHKSLMEMSSAILLH